MSKITFAILLSLFFARSANAATLQANSCSRADVQSAIDSASDGDTVIVPSGNCTWTSAVTISNKAIVVQGAGIDQTVITDATSDTWGDSPFWIIGQEGKPFRITGFTFNGTSDNNGVIFISGTCKNFRIDHIKFVDVGSKCIEVFGYTYGVIDNCIFTGDIGSGIRVKDAYPGDGARLRPVSLGTANAVYIEDCTFTYDDWDANELAIDAQSSGCFVFRHNTLDTTYLGTHGTDSGGEERGVYYFEVYENIIHNPASSYFTGMLFRGGTGVIYGNTITGNFQQGVRLDNFRCHIFYPDRGYCDGTSPWDGNQEPNGYPCIDQIGRGQEQSTPPPWGNQVLDPLYVWGNTLNGVETDAVVASGAANWIIEGRDFYNDTQKPGYTAYTYPHPLTGGAGGSAFGGGDSGGGVCFIATAAYGSYMEPHLSLLRQFSYHFLLTSAAGKAFVDFYYTYSPSVAEFIATHDTLRSLVRMNLLPLVGASYMLFYLGPAASLAIMLLLLGLLSVLAVLFVRRL